MMANRPGRPPLDRDDKSVVVSFRLPGRAFERLCWRAHLERLTVPEVIRRGLPKSAHKDYKNRDA